ncbi:heterodisulfide reductase-related iron-sulfur binding cluster [Acidithiobacillus ferrooxidans]|jgi:heterodisulfide reductase subunit B|uniref:heterodisulfide reductase-related iron-sulfur binding cluster n=1 Tax=Acidithiobacillus ferrooxidans TaxID=920 RepID=UPI0015DCBC05|nr:heterodisulfide reductase-related iron-sulfur binding cluster [Acidithiobacillus ferrooxidans]MCR1343286.1 heterodisulfide reductase-related iron-sulfur binding cluster [Acidithiobacillus ferrooxidans]QLK43761.1 heterodisulfide reductase subunit B [Acidithiobacillus ferrooxidans]QZT54364.1 heterodisulfide reductase subunit B [Acidithiobacillus ferrooxidans]BDB15952.1 heterodisulfide reductase subunit B [Acidithiobacillus ferrooxidans]
MNDNSTQQGVAGHGAFFQDTNLSANEAEAATAWVRSHVDRRSIDLGERMDDIRDHMWELEKEGEIIVHRINPGHQAEVVKTLYGWDKKIPTNNLWHHKSCGQCGNIPGYPTSLMWFMNKLGIDYLDETDQTSCTAWNYHGSGIGNVESLAAVFLRNFHQAYVSGKQHGFENGHFFPLVHCGTSFGNYKEIRKYLIESAELREKVKKILGKLGRLVDGKIVIPEEVVHYSEWLHVMRHRIASELQTIDVSHIRVAVHPACHVYKMVPEDAIYDPEILGGNRVAVTTSVAMALGAQVIDYSTWYDCCGFGFRHIISEREFTRSFTMNRKIKVVKEEAKADVLITHDTGCVTTMDKNQWIGKAHDMNFSVPVIADVQLAALACGADPFKIVQLQWHASPCEDLVEKMGISWDKAKAHFQDYLKQVEQGNVEYLYNPELAVDQHINMNAG